ncbi:MAG: alpha/beta fold hydrolase [Candidatus Eiseniibacteriota bacterium]
MKSLLDESRVLINTCSESMKFYTGFASIFVDAWIASTRIILGYKNWNDLEGLEKAWLPKCREIFEVGLKDKDFVTSLSIAIDCYSRLAQSTGIGQFYQNISNITSLWNNYFVEPIRDTFWRTPSHKIFSEGKFALLRYNQDRDLLTSKAPVLILYAFINRHYILDLLPEVSIVRSLLNNGLDLFAADWGTPSSYDQNLTLDYYVDNYVDKSVEEIRKQTNSDKVSIFGYCWGGDLALIYAAQHPEKVKNVITLATPGNSDLDDTLLTNWIKNLKVDSLVDAFGNVPSWFLNAAFALRSPIDYLHKYSHFLEKRHDMESILEFFATELWLYDSPPVIGEIYRELAKRCYQENLLIKNQMKADNGTIIDLKNIKVPFLNIVAKKDDLVAPASSKAITDAVGSDDKCLIEFDSGHVGACISSQAHRELWPKVGEWIATRS